MLEKQQVSRRQNFEDLLSTWVWEVTDRSLDGPRCLVGRLGAWRGWPLLGAKERMGYQARGRVELESGF